MTVRPEHKFKSKAGGSISPWTHWAYHSN